MASILTFATFVELVEHNDIESESTYFIYFHLLKMLSTVDNDQISVFDAYNVIDGNHSSICIHMTGNYFIYSDSYNEAIIDEILKKIQLNKFTNFYFVGKRDLILDLFRKSNCSFEVIKDRLIYSCSEVMLQNANKLTGDVKNASIDDFEDLVTMSLDNHIEEYDGKGSKDRASMELLVSDGIETDTLYCLFYEEEIASIAQVINDFEKGKPYIGNLYTKPKFRNRGCAFSLLYIITEGFLKEGFKECGLISDITNQASNVVFRNVGYKTIYKWIYVFKG